jgi:hypothetical protein
LVAMTRSRERRDNAADVTSSAHGPRLTWRPGWIRDVPAVNYFKGCSNPAP